MHLFLTNAMGGHDLVGKVILPGGGQAAGQLKKTVTIAEQGMRPEGEPPLLSRLADSYMVCALPDPDANTTTLLISIPPAVPPSAHLGTHAAWSRSPSPAPRAAVIS